MTCGLANKSGASAPSRSEARRLTDQVRADALTLAESCLQLYGRKVHVALGYPSWAAYWVAEFGQGKSTAYKVLDAARRAEPGPLLLPEPPASTAARARC